MVRFGIPVAKFKPVRQAAEPGSTIRTKRLNVSEMEHTFEQHASGPFGEEIPKPWLSFDGTLREYESIFPEAPRLRR